MQTSQSESMKDHPLIACAECGETYLYGSEPYLMECERCLSKREE